MAYITITTVEVSQSDVSFGNCPVGLSTWVTVTLSLRIQHTIDMEPDPGGVTPSDQTVAFFGGMTFTDKRFSCATAAQRFSMAQPLQVTIVFTPTGAGQVTGTGAFEVDVDNGLYVNLAGVGTIGVPSIKVVPSAHDYGRIHAGTTRAVDFVVSTEYSLPLNISSITLRDPFVAGTPTPGPMTVPAQGSAHFGIVFSPPADIDAAYDLTDAARIVSDGGPDVLLHLSGSASLIALSVAPETVTVDVGESTTITATVSSGSVTWTCSDPTAITPNGLSCVFSTSVISVETYTVRATSTVDTALWAECVVSVWSLTRGGVVRAGGSALRVVEAKLLPAFLESPRFPDDISYGCTGGPTFRTLVGATAGGWEQRKRQWSESLTRWNVAHGLKSKQQLVTLNAFFRNCYGKALGFRFKDWLDYKAIAAQIGVGTGSTTAFQLVKPYVVGNLIQYRTITKPVAGTVHVFVDGVAAAFECDTATGIVTLTSAPPTDAIITADFEFDTPVRFDTDQMSVALEFFDTHNWENIPVVEIRP